MDEQVFDYDLFFSNMISFLDNKKRSDYVRENIDKIKNHHLEAIISGSNLDKLIEIQEQHLVSLMAHNGTYNTIVSIPDVNRPKEKNESIERIVLSCHTDAIRMNWPIPFLTDKVGPGGNDNASGCAVNLKLFEDSIMNLKYELEINNQFSSDDYHKTTYAFFAGEEGTINGVSGLTLALLGISTITANTVNPINSSLANFSSIASMIVSLGLMEKSKIFLPGLIGSAQWAQSLSDKYIEEIIGVINLDMVGDYADGSIGAPFGFLRTYMNIRDEWKTKESNNIIDSVFRKISYSLNPLFSVLDKIIPDNNKDIISVVVPSVTMSTGPLSWINPGDHSKMSSYLSEIIYANGIKNGKKLNKRDSVAIGSSDHARIREVLLNRGYDIPTALMIGLGGNHRIHKKEDTYVNNEHLDLTYSLVKDACLNMQNKWKSIEQINEIGNIDYYSIFSGNDETIVVLRSKDNKRDMWVNRFCRLDIGLSELEEISCLKLDTNDGDWDWNLSNHFIDSGILDGYTEYKPVNIDIMFDETKYHGKKSNVLSKYYNNSKAKVVDFFARRPLLGLVPASMMGTIAPLYAGIELSQYVSRNISGVDSYLEILAGTIPILFGAVGALKGFLTSIELFLDYSNVWAETHYDTMAEMINHNMHKAIQYDK